MYSTQEWINKGQYFEFEGKQIFYVLEGSKDKPWLVLLHGFPTSSWDWQLIWDDLCRHFRVLALDFIGFGASDKPRDHHYHVREQATIVEALLAHEKVQRFHLLAHDFGDTAAQELIARDNARETPLIETVVLTNGGLFPETHRPVLIQRLLMSSLGPWVARLASFRRFKGNFDHICARPIGEEELREHWRLINLQQGRRVMHKLIHYMEERRQHRERWVTALQEYSGPMCLINGVEDPISGEHMVARYEALVSREYIYRLPGVGHYPQLEEPVAFIRACTDFWGRA